MSMSTPIQIYGHKKDLGGLSVTRLLPNHPVRSVGPFLFLDHMGPADFTGHDGLSVRPHPHIGLSTLTYLFEGSILHRDSLGNEVIIYPGEVNWMTAGSGIAHSERTNTEDTSNRLNGLQFWIGLPKEFEETSPAFSHYPTTALPAIKGPGSLTKLIAGKAFLRQSPVETHSPLFFLDTQLEPGGSLVFHPTIHDEAAVYVIQGKVSVDNTQYDEGSFIFWERGQEIKLYSKSNSRFVILGGQPFPEKRFLWWNFVSSSQERIEKAKQDWLNGQFPKVINETEFIPLPE